jgi:hypothetical protein
MPNRQDTFDRADSSTSLGTPSDGGTAWQVAPNSPNTVYGISSNQAKRFSTNDVPGGEIAWLETDMSDVEVTVTIANISTGGANEMGIVARLTDEQNYIRCRIAPTLVQIAAIQAGATTAIAGTADTVVAGDVFRLICNGTSIKVIKNPAESPTNTILSGTSSFNQTATKCGLRGNATINSGLYDNFTVTNIGGSFEEEEGTVQLLSPVSDISAGTWLPSSGSPAELWEMLDGEKSPDDDYCYTTSAGTMEVKFAPGGVPSVLTGHTLRYRLRGNGTCDALVKLKVGSTVLAQWTETNVPAVDTEYEHTLDSSPSFTISDYSDLRISVEAVP